MLESGERLRWKSSEGSSTRYFRILGVGTCDFPIGEHVDLIVEEELRTIDSIALRQSEIVRELNDLAEKGFGDEFPLTPITLADLFGRADKQGRRELLRFELGDLAEMLESLKKHE